MKNIEFLDPNIARKNKLVEEHLKDRVSQKTPPLFSIIEFNLSGLCNRRCIFCPRVDSKAFPSINKHMPQDSYEKVMADLKQVSFDGTILYSAFSEPLLYKELETIIRLSRHYLPNARIEIVTNGDFVTPERIKKLFSAGLMTLCISMYDGPHQLKHFEKLRRETGLKKNQLIFRIRWLPPEQHFGITLSNRAGTIEMKNIGIVTPTEPLRRACFYPFYQILVDYDGAVLLCAHDWGRKLIVGNINDESILKIWNNGVLKDIRRKLAKSSRDFSPCNECDAKGVLIGRNHFNKWSRYYENQKYLEK